MGRPAVNITLVGQLPGDRSGVDPGYADEAFVLIRMFAAGKLDRDLHWRIDLPCLRGIDISERVGDISANIRTNFVAGIKFAFGPFEAVLGRRGGYMGELTCGFTAEGLIAGYIDQGNSVAAGVKGELTHLSALFAVYHVSADDSQALGMVEESMQRPGHRVLADHRHRIDRFIHPLEPAGGR